jgi:4-amino-4-deoxy-L-arabinose transferase
VEHEARSRRLIPVVFLFVAVLLGIGASSVPLFDPDESRFARTSLEMQRSGDPVVPTFEGRPRLVKPPLFHWVQSSLFSVFGTGGWVARLPSLLATLATLWLTAAVARRRFGEQGAFWATVCLATMPLVVFLGKIGTLDALLALHVWAVVAYDLDERPSPWPYGLLLGLAFLIKGPVGVAVPLLMILAGRTASGRPVAPSLRGAMAAVAAWALVVLPWGLAFVGRVGGTAFDTLRTEVWSRVSTGTDHVEPFWYYLPVLFVVCLPWFVPFVSALFRVVRLAVDPASRSARYLAAAWLAGVVIFSLSRGKLPNYILPLLPAMAMLCSWELARQLEIRKKTRVPALLVSTLGTFAIGFGIAGAGQPAGPLRLAAWVGAAAYGLATVAAMPFLLRRRPLRVWQLAAAAQAVFLLIAVVFLPAEISRTRTTAWLLDAVPDLGQGRPVAMVDMKVPSLTWYLDRVPEEIDLAHLGEGLDRDAGHLYLFDRRDWERVPQQTRARLRLVGEQGKYRVYERVDESSPPG